MKAVLILIFSRPESECCFSSVYIIGLEVPSKKLIYTMLEICKRKLLMNERFETDLFLKLPGK